MSRALLADTGRWIVFPSPRDQRHPGARAAAGGLSQASITTTQMSQEVFNAMTGVGEGGRHQVTQPPEGLEGDPASG